MESYSLVKAQISASHSRLLRYGALALIEDRSRNASYIGMVVEVRESAPIPVIDSRGAEVLRSAATREHVPVQKIYEVLYDPSRGLVEWVSTRLVDLRVLGQVEEGADGASLRLPSRPPSVLSRVLPPPASLLQQFYQSGDITIGVHAYHEDVNVRLASSKFTMHVAILGQTGSGKTETVKRIVAEYAWSRPVNWNGGVLVLDTTGEYTGYPYSNRPGAYPLLDAILYSQSFTTRHAGWLAEAPKTILILYDPGRLTYYTYSRGERRYFSTLVEMSRRLSEEHQREYNKAECFDVVMIGRYGYYGYYCSVNRQHSNCLDVAGAIRSTEHLLLAIPLPSTLPSSIVRELAQTTSRSFEEDIEHLAEIMGLLEGDKIAAVPGLAALTRLLYWGGLSPQTLANAIASAARAYFEQANKRLACERYRSILQAGRRGIVYTGWVDCNALVELAAYMLTSLQEEPGEGIENTGAGQASPWDILAGLLGRGDTRSRERAMKTAFERVKGFLQHLHPATASSLIRGLQRVARHTSPLLDRQLWLLVMERIMNGFTIVHLAPPSTALDEQAAHLLSEAFHYSVVNYQPGRQVLVVVEEAHNLAPADGNPASKKPLIRMAREGRKWGLSLLLVSQRPGFLDPSVLSQAASTITLRMTNPDDINAVRRGAEAATQEVINHLPDLEQGQAIVTGLILPERRIPALVRVTQLRPIRSQQQGNNTPQQPPNKPQQHRFSLPNQHQESRKSTGSERRRKS